MDSDVTQNPGASNRRSGVTVHVMDSQSFLGEKDKDTAVQFRDYLVDAMKVAREPSQRSKGAVRRTTNQAREACLTAVIVMARAQSNPNFRYAASIFKDNPELGDLVQYWARNITDGIRQGDKPVLGWLKSFMNAEENPTVSGDEVTRRALCVHRLMNEFEKPAGNARIALLVDATMPNGLSTHATVRPPDAFDDLLAVAKDLQGFSAQREPPDLAFKNADKVR